MSSDDAKGVTPLQRAALLVALALLPFTIARLLLLCAYYSDFAELGGLHLLGCFVAGLRFDVATILPFMAVSLVMLNLPVTVAGNQRWRSCWGWLALAPLVPISLLLCGDLLYYGEVRRHVTRELRLVAHDTGYLAEMALLHPVSLSATLALVVAVGVLGHWALKRPHRAPTQRVAPLLLIAALCALGIRGSVSRKPLNPIDAYRGQSFAAGNLQLNGVYTAVRATLDGVAEPENPLAVGDAYRELGLDSSLPFPVSGTTIGTKGTTARQNLVVVLLESWDARYMGCYGKTSSLTPRFDEFAKGGLLFDNAYASTQRTIGGIQAVLTGVPSVPGIPELGHGLEHTNVTRVAALAKEHGYSTLFLQAPRRRSYYLDSVMNSLGFDEVYGLEDYPLVRSYGGETAKWGWDHDALQFVAERIAALPEPFLVVVLTGTTHSPYANPGAPFNQSEHQRHGLGGYENTLRYSDWALGEFLDRSRRSAWFKRTTWLLAADHVFRGGGGDLRDSFRIPLLLRGPGIKPGRAPGVYSQLDCLPTFLQIMGIRGAYSAMGTSLLGQSKGYALVRMGGLLGLIASDRYLTHTIERRVEAKQTEGSGSSGWTLDRLERRLLALQRVSVELVRKNRWAARRGRQ